MSYVAELDRVDVFLFEAPPDAAGEEDGEDDGGQVADPQHGEEVLVQLDGVEDNPGGEGVERRREVDEEEHDGHRDAQDPAAKDDMHGQEVFASVTEHVDLVGGSVTLAGVGAVVTTIHVA